MLQSVAVLHRVLVCCDVLQRVAYLDHSTGNVVQCVALCCVLHCVAVANISIVLRCVAVCCCVFLGSLIRVFSWCMRQNNTLQHAATYCSTLQSTAAQVLPLRCFRHRHIRRSNIEPYEIIYLFAFHVDINIYIIYLYTYI